MAIEVVRHGDVTRLRMTSAGSRAVGLGVSAYVVRGVMVDTGFHRARHEVRGAIRELGIQGAIVTHWHEDHAGNVAMLAAEGFPLAMRGDTEAILRRRPAIQLYRRVVWGHPPALEAAASAVSFESVGLTTLHTPGHSTDHQIVWDRESGTLFSGDLWLGVRARVLHSTEDPYQIVESLRVARTLGPARMFDAHRGFVADAVAALDAKIEWLGEILAAVEREVLAGASDRAIVRRVLGGEEAAAYISRGDYSRRNLVKAVRRRLSDRG